MNTAELVEYFRFPKSLYGVEHLSDVPQHSGFCAVYSLQVPKQVDLSKCIEWNSHFLLHIGYSSNLSRRVKNHFYGNASISIFRKSVGCLLSEELHIHLQDIKGRCRFGAGEDVLSEWILENVKIAWQLCESPKLYKSGVIKELSPPLNLNHNPHNPLKDELKRLHGECKKN